MKLKIKELKIILASIFGSVFFLLYHIDINNKAMVTNPADELIVMIYFVIMFFTLMEVLRHEA
jgi:DMSO/TMAO reductase YedYZ heme-binding membrane subunit